VIAWARTQSQLSLRVSENFGAALPFSHESTLAILHRLRCLARRSPRGEAARFRSEPDWHYHVPFNCFDGSAHMFLSFCVNNDRPSSALLRKTMFLVSA
jgi:hypothetical protein